MRLSRLMFASFAAVAALAATRLPAPRLLISIDKSAQQMTVTVDGDPRYVWPVSTGVSGYDTPSGEYKPFRMERDHFSREWDDAPMPHSIFFTQQGHAIHGSDHVKAIGTPASHGCVRLEPRNAAILFALVRQEKMANTRVVLSGAGRRRRRGARGARKGNKPHQRSFTAGGDDTALTPCRAVYATTAWRELPADDRPRYIISRRPAVLSRRRRYGCRERAFPTGDR